MEIIRGVIVQDVVPQADGIYSYDLPINPLSHVILTIKALNNLAEATLENILSMIPKVEVLHRGTGIISMSAKDLYALNCIFFGRSPILTNRVPTDNAVRSLSLIIPMGRKIYNPLECFPATRSGEFKIQLTCDISVTNADTLTLQVETVELFEASPENYIKATTLAQTPTAVGDNDLELPIGNVLFGVLLFGTTFPSGTSWVSTIKQVKFLVDNKEHGYAKANWESMKSNLAFRTGYLGDRSPNAGNDELVEYVLIDFDPIGDGNFVLNTKGKSDVRIRYTAGNLQPIRAVPFELVAVS